MVHGGHWSDCFFFFICTHISVKKKKSDGSMELCGTYLPNRREDELENGTSARCPSSTCYLRLGDSSSISIQKLHPLTEWTSAAWQTCGLCDGAAPVLSPGQPHLWFRGCFCFLFFVLHFSFSFLQVRGEMLKVQKALLVMTCSCSSTVRQSSVSQAQHHWPWGLENSFQ